MLADFSSSFAFSLAFKILSIFFPFSFRFFFNGLPSPVTPVGPSCALLFLSSISSDSMLVLLLKCDNHTLVSGSAFKILVTVTFQTPNVTQNLTAIKAKPAVVVKSLFLCFYNGKQEESAKSQASGPSTEPGPQPSGGRVYSQLPGQEIHTKPSAKFDEDLRNGESINASGVQAPNAYSPFQTDPAEFVQQFLAVFQVAICEDLKSKRADNVLAFYLAFMMSCEGDETHLLWEEFFNWILNVSTLKYTAHQSITE